MPTKRSGPLVGKCPKCGNNIVLKKSFYGCSNYPECKFTLAEHFRKKKLTKTNGGNVKEVMEIRLRSKLKSVLIVHYLKILYNRN
ncbi:hypothetical protein E2N93_00195 [Ruminococcus bromii]|uniref:DNA topoisomerase type IA zn finger domain-containing protein n=1 Tax=Ruminococcus bromii TaxID=40518 RepID=A0ABT0NFM3_9FIRM|nr:hypothetical protein [Ruminococcus bromii]